LRHLVRTLTSLLTGSLYSSRDSFVARRGADFLSDASLELCSCYFVTLCYVTAAGIGLVG